ncbi:MAG: hypothetical protein AAGA48_12285 [Myxococcota bacterium]
MNRRLWGLLVLVVLTLVVPTTSGAADDDFVIVGEILKPEITVVISRENLNKAYELKLEESFLDKIIQSVESAPF